MTSVDFSGLVNVTQVGARFLQNCSSVTTLDISPLSNVTQINASFLVACNSLTALDLSALSVTQVGPRFLWNYSSLTTLDLSPLSNVTREEEGHSLAHRGTDYYLVREESCAEQDVPHIVLFYMITCNAKRKLNTAHYSHPFFHFSNPGRVGVEPHRQVEVCAFHHNLSLLSLLFLLLFSGVGEKHKKEK